MTWDITWEDVWSLTGIVAGAAGLVVGAVIATIWLALRHRAALKRTRVNDGAVRQGLEERARASDRARRERDLILATMQDGVVLFDGRGRTRFANDAVAGHLGARPTELGSLLPLGLRRGAAHAAERGETISTLVELGSPSRWLRAVTSPAGEDGSVLLVIRDVTQARLADEVRRDFVANASHELKSPAASIQAAAETIHTAATEDPQAVPRFARRLERDAVRLSRIVSDLLDLSRLEGGSELSERVRLDSLVQEEGRRLREEAQAAGLTLSVSAPEEAPVRGSARDLSLLIHNLVDNAIRYSGSEGTVRLSTEVNDSTVRLEVADEGVGIPTKDLPRIFERFYRVDRARSRDTGGTGLGLAIVKHVAENHGGQVSVVSELGRGTTFRVELALA